ncbi:AAA family ATPase [uncultured Desulfosarcina sp.]|uniref:bifunctional aminoglycoside phosphotransferase/ATP-binding protein n=1 Tax=uncultured Desulfosarcina sp. TaxID=218289 RepID=UPI0029C989FC|nr:AAA family ATPase [uncultured Desulfosarcina sp.]
MEKNHQAEILETMMQASFYPHPVETVQRRETHISTVFLTGPFVYKIKKPVDLGFLDFTSLEKRRHFCLEEIVLNRRLSHGVYIDAVPITRHDRTYRLGGSGPTVEFAVKMHQLADTDSMQQRLQRGTLDDTEIESLARLLVGFYEQTATVCNAAPTAPLAWEENLQLAEAFAGVWIDRQEFEFVRSAARSFYRRHQRLFHRRRMEGKIKDGHGDLRTDHIYFTKTGIQIIDCIEFNDQLRILDIISDLAFLIMDLEYIHFSETAKSLIRWYVNLTDDVGSLPLLPFFCCYRAMVRCKVNCFHLLERSNPSADSNILKSAAGRCLAMAHGYAAAFNRPILWIVCGLPASGKSTIASALAAVLDLNVIRSDMIRKELFSGSPAPSDPDTYGTGMYSALASEATYKRLFVLAQEDLKKGKSVIIDATFSRASRLAQALRLATGRQATPVLVECRAAEATLAARLLKRETEPSVSDARLIHLEAFKKRFETIAPVGNTIHIFVDTENPPAVCLRQILLTDSLLGFTRIGGNHV